MSQAKLQFFPNRGDDDGLATPRHGLGEDPATYMETCFRELVQNAMDSCLLEADLGTAKVEFEICRVQVEDIPGIEQYKKAWAQIGQERSLQEKKTAKNIYENINSYVSKGRG